MLTVHTISDNSNLKSCAWIISGYGGCKALMLPATFSSETPIEYVDKTYHVGYLKGEQGPASENEVEHCQVVGDYYPDDPLAYWLSDTWPPVNGGYELPLRYWYTPDGVFHHLLSAVLGPQIWGNTDCYHNGTYFRYISRIDGDDIYLSYQFGWQRVYATIVDGYQRIKDAEAAGLDTVGFGSVTFTANWTTRKYYYTWQATLIVSSDSISAVPESLRSRALEQNLAALDSIARNLQHPSAPNWSEMANECYTSTSYFEGNAAQYLREMVNIKQLMPPVSALLNLKSPKSWGKLYLWLHYGIRLSISDTKTLVQGIRRFISDDTGVYLGLQSKYSTRFISTDTTLTRANLKISFKPRDGTSAWIKSKMFDANLTLENVWDMIPFSFVVDWLTNIGWYLDQYETTAQRYAYYSLVSIMYSLRTEIDIDTTLLPNPIGGTLKAVRYDRWKGTSLPPANFSTEWTPDPERHWIEAAALWVAK